jgi:hypothetical protein
MTMESTVMDKPEQIVKQTSKNPNYHFKQGNSYGKGRPPGTHNKLSVKSLLAQLSDTVGIPYEQQLAENYRAAIVNNDTKLIHAYDNLFLSKLLADKVSVEVSEDAAIVDAKREAFMGALRSYGQAVIVEHNAITIDATVTDNRVEDGTQDSTEADQDRARDDNRQGR